MIVTALDGWQWRVDYHQQVVEQEDFSLVDAAALTPVGVGNLKKLTAAHQPAVRQRQHLGYTHTCTQTHTGLTPRLTDLRSSIGGGGGAYGLLADHHALHRLDLRHVVIVGPQLPLLDASIDGDKQVAGDVLTIVHA